MCGVRIFMRSAEMGQSAAARSTSAQRTPISSLVRTTVKTIHFKARRA